ncbi:hypothetical protein ACFVHB_26715 [Kitasatospora sp. NPDC127111]|uniref:hypothetical protein n=1 Tax=Kitasatospora sp. NPDC127111 TaxID=3345363 RepID=UPI0036429557
MSQFIEPAVVGRAGQAVRAGWTAGGGPGRRGPLSRWSAGDGLCCATGHSFTVATLIGLPAAYLAVFELAEDHPGGDLGLLLLGVAPLLLLPFAIGARLWAAHGRAALRWAGRAALRYLCHYLTSIVLMAELVALAFSGSVYLGGGTGFPLETYVAVPLFTAVLFGAPALLALLMVAPWASTGRRARLALGLLTNLLPAWLFLLGGFPVGLVIVAHVVFACRVVPAAPARPARPAGPVEE